MISLSFSLLSPSSLRTIQMPKRGCQLSPRNVTTHLEIRIGGLCGLTQPIAKISRISGWRIYLSGTSMVWKVAATGALLMSWQEAYNPKLCCMQWEGKQLEIRLCCPYCYVSIYSSPFLRPPSPAPADGGVPAGRGDGRRSPEHHL